MNARTRREAELRVVRGVLVSTERFYVRGELAAETRAVARIGDA